MNEQEPRPPEVRPAAERACPDWRRLEVARTRFFDRVADGIAQAMAERTEINDSTARCIAHVLGRAYGRDSYLAEFGRTGESNYLSLRDEYLKLYGDQHVDAITKEWIDWLGTYLVQGEKVGSGRCFMNEHQPPSLERLLVRSSVHIGDEDFLVNIPASWDSGDTDELIELLTDLRLPEDQALQAFLSLPDVSVGSGNIMESFHENYVQSYPFIVDAVRDLAELDALENVINDESESRALPDGAVQIDYTLIEEHVREAYDLVEWKGYVHVFNK